MSIRPGLTRRDLLLAGAGTMLGLAPRPGARASSVTPTATARSVVLVWLWGGPAPLDPFDPQLDLAVVDNGSGLPAQYAPGIGLVSMRQRAAELGGICNIERDPKGGTIVRAGLPVGDAPEGI